MDLNCIHPGTSFNFYIILFLLRRKLMLRNGLLPRVTQDHTGPHGTKVEDHTGPHKTT